MASRSRRDGPARPCAGPPEAAAGLHRALAEPLVGAGLVALAHLVPAPELALEGILIHARQHFEPVVRAAVAVADGVQLARLGHPRHPVRRAVASPPAQSQ